MENKKRNSVATVLLTIVCILWMYPIVLILINSLKKEVAITTSGVFSFQPVKHGMVLRTL